MCDFSGLENGTITEEDLEKAKSMLPLSLASFVDRKLPYNKLPLVNNS